MSKQSKFCAAASSRPCIAWQTWKVHTSCEPAVAQTEFSPSSTFLLGGLNLAANRRRRPTFFVTAVSAHVFPRDTLNTRRAPTRQCFSSASIFDLAHIHCHCRAKLTARLAAHARTRRHGPAG